MTLTILIFAPVVAALILGLLPEKNRDLVRNVAVVLSLTVFGFSVGIFLRFESASPMLQFVENVDWISQLGIHYHLGVDGFSIWLILLTTFLTPISILASYNGISERVRLFNAMLLLLEAGMLGVFLAQDLILFYMFWELMLVPMYFIIGIWGYQDRIKATIVFVLYTIVGSLLMLVAMVSLAITNARNLAQATGQSAASLISFDLADIHVSLLTPDQQVWLFLAFFFAFMIKVPLFPVHTWLPLAHVQAPTAGSVILAGVLLKTGAYAIIRFCLGLFPVAAMQFAPWINTLAVIGIVYGALLSFVQDDFKKLVAYSSVSHMGFIVLGIFSFTVEGMTGGVIQMVNHGISTGGLFLCVGMLYERSHTRKFSELGGVATAMPVYAGMFLVITLSSVALPGLNGFVGEFLTLAGAFKNVATRWWAIVGATGMILAAVYLLWMFQQAIYTTKPGQWVQRTWSDLSLREVAVLAPIVAATIWIGVYPKPLLGPMEISSQSLLGRMDAQRAAVEHVTPDAIVDARHRVETALAQDEEASR